MHARLWLIGGFLLKLLGLFLFECPANIQWFYGMIKIIKM